MITIAGVVGSWNKVAGNITKSTLRIIHTLEASWRAFSTNSTIQVVSGIACIAGGGILTLNTIWGAV